MSMELLWNKQVLRKQHIQTKVRQHEERQGWFFGRNLASNGEE